MVATPASIAAGYPAMWIARRVASSIRVSPWSGHPSWLALP